MLVIGGRASQVGQGLPLEVYDTESSEWSKFKSISRFRHSSWPMDTHVYVHGGFEHDTPNIPIDAIDRIDVNMLFNNFPSLQTKICPKPSGKSKEGATGKNQNKKQMNNFYCMQ